MAGGYSITITAIDRASKQIEAINKRIAAVNAPVERMQRQLAKLAESTGLASLDRGMRGLARRALQAFQNVGRLVPALGAITGAASVVGLERLVSAWAEFGQRLGFSAQRIGISTDRLQALQNAARLAGASAQSLTGGMQSLRDNLVNAAAGRAPDVIYMLNTLGITLRDSRGNIRAATDVLPQLADKIAAIRDPTRQAMAAVALLGSAGETLLPFLRRGSAGIEDYVQKATYFGVINERGAMQARNLREAQTELWLAVEGLGNAIAGDLAPVLAPLLHQFADWIAKNRQWIATKIEEKVHDFATWLKSIDWQKVGAGVEKFGAAAQSVATAVGGWQHVFEGFMTYLVGSWLVRGLAAITKYTTAISVGLTGAFKLATAAADAMNTRLMANPAFRTLTLLLQSYDTIKNGIDPKDMPTDSPLWRDMSPEQQRQYPNSPLNNPAGASQPGLLGRIERWLHGAAVPRGVRDNNPLNLHYVPGQPWALGSDNGESVYQSRVEGIAAAERQLLLYQDRDHLNTVRGIVTKWAPPGENDSAAYASAVARQMGVALDQPLNLRDQAVAASLITAMGRQETGMTLGADTVRQGIALALGAPLALPGGSAPGAAAPHGTASLNIRVESGAGLRTTTRAATSGDLFTGAPRIDTALPPTGVP